MTKLVEAVLNKNFDLAAVMLEEKFASIMVKLIPEKKKMVAANICEDDIEESIDPTEIYNGPKPKGQRVNRADKGDKQPPNTTVVPKNNLKEEGEEDRPHKLNALRKQKDAEVTRKVNTLTDIKNTINSTDKALGVLGVKNNLADSDKIQSQIDSAKKTRPYNEETEEKLYEARIKIIKARVRGGKVQRRVKKSNVAGMTLRGGKLTRMSPAERRRRKMGARKAKLKRKSQMGRILMKRKRSMNRRKAMGI